MLISHRSRMEMAWKALKTLTFGVIASVSLLVISPTQASESTQIISQRMKTAEVIRGDFVQEKLISIMSRPLNNAGQFTLHRQKGIWWHNNTPIHGDMIITDAGIVQRSTTGTIQRIDSAQQPALKIMTAIIRQLVSGDWQQLSAHFSIETKVSPESWTAILTPKPGSLFDRYATRVELKGQEFVTHIAIQEKTGDNTKIQFSDLNHDTQLQSSETDAFAW